MKKTQYKWTVQPDSPHTIAVTDGERDICIVECKGDVLSEED